MKIIYQEEAKFYHDFLPLIIELRCGKHYDPSNKQHVDWLRQNIAILYMQGAKAICLYTEDDKPVGFLFLLHDKGLENVCCFGKKAVIDMLGLFDEYRNQGLGVKLIEEAAKYVRENGGECIYVDTYAANSGAIRFYSKNGFIPVALHPGENSRDDLGQVYLYKEV